MDLGPIKDLRRYWFVSFAHVRGFGNIFIESDYEGKLFSFKEFKKNVETQTGTKEVIVLNFVELSKEDYISATTPADSEE